MFDFISDILILSVYIVRSPSKYLIVSGDMARVLKIVLGCAPTVVHRVREFVGAWGRAAEAWRHATPLAYETWISNGFGVLMRNKKTRGTPRQVREAPRRLEFGAQRLST
jgi:hypothetical protein